MDPISNNDRILLLLRQRLEERSRTQRRTGSTTPRDTGGRSPLAPVRALVAAGTATDRQLRKAVIQSVLTEQFGEALINDAKFQAVADQVTDAISTDEAASALVSKVIAELSAQASPRAR